MLAAVSVAFVFVIVALVVVFILNVVVRSNFNNPNKKGDRK